VAFRTIFVNFADSYGKVALRRRETFIKIKNLYCPGWKDGQDIELHHSKKS
jgi:hypothetical protein